MEKKKIFIVFLLIFALSLKGSEKEPFLKGQSASPFINTKGEFLFLYQNQDEGLSLATKKIQARECQVQEIFVNLPVSSPVVKKNRKGEIGVVWLETLFEKNEIYFGLFEENAIISIKKVSDGSDPKFSPDFDYDSENNIWVAWIQYSNERSWVVVKNINSNKIWLIDSPSLKDMRTPKLVASPNNSLWLFWLGRDKGRDEIFYCIFSQDEWSSPRNLNQDNRFPHTFLDVTLGPQGFPWVVWSSYDGNDYEIFCSSWNGENWSGEEQLTENCEMDSYPILSFALDSFPLVFWCKSYAKKSGIYCRYKFADKWSQEIAIFQSGGRPNRFPRVAIQKEKIGITWESGGHIESEFLTFSQLVEGNLPKDKQQDPDNGLHDSLDENTYIGFGDSITFGGMDYEEHPEKGYVPRLEVFLTQYFCPTKVINEGIGGETTLDGLARIDEAMAKHLAKYLLLMYGTNDVIFLEISMDTSAFNLKEMARKCLNFGVYPLLATIIPRNDWRWYRKIYQNRIFELNGKIPNVTESLKIPLVDQFNIFYNYPEEDGGWKSLISSDNTHPSEKGYQAMAETWFKEIKILLFPPVSVSVKKSMNRSLFSAQEGNSITWQNNPKISYQNSFFSYNIYRDEGNREQPDFKLIATLPASIFSHQLQYFDAKIISSSRYRYMISTLRNDGIEGPYSDLLND